MTTPTDPSFSRRPTRMRRLSARVARAKRRAVVVTSTALLAAGGTVALAPLSASETGPTLSIVEAPPPPATLLPPPTPPAVPVHLTGDLSAEAGTPLGGGEASYYGAEFAGRPTASGEPFDPSALTAAHRTLPLGTRVRVTHARTGESVVVRVNDRGPFHGDRVIDVSRAAADAIGLTQSGTADVELTRLSETRGVRG